MRYIIAFLAALLAGCPSSSDDILVDAERSLAEAARQVGLKQNVSAFEGAVTGKDQGEWGGEIAFRAADGTAYTLVAGNSHGIFAMPYGVFAITGLAHLSANRGAVYQFSRRPGARVTATLLTQLPGAPCNVFRVGDRIVTSIVRDISGTTMALHLSKSSAMRCRRPRSWFPTLAQARSQRCASGEWCSSSKRKRFVAQSSRSAE